MERAAGPDPRTNTSQLSSKVVAESPLAILCKYVDLESLSCADDLDGMVNAQLSHARKMLMLIKHFILMLQSAGTTNDAKVY